MSRGPRQAHLDGFDLHANVWVSGNDRAGLERLCRYVLRPPFAQERLRRRSDGPIALELKTAWHDSGRDGRRRACAARRHPHRSDRSTYRLTAAVCRHTMPLSRA